VGSPELNLLLNRTGADISHTQSENAFYFHGPAVSSRLYETRSTPKTDGMRVGVYRDELASTLFARFLWIEKRCDLPIHNSAKDLAPSSDS
jgi:hypothetical protein